MANGSAASAAFDGGWHALARAALGFTFVLGVASFAAVTALTCLARHHWVADIVSHFRMHLTAGGLVLVAFALICGYRRAALLPFALALVHAAWLLWPLPAPAATATGADLRVVTFNVMYWNPDYRRTQTYMRELRPDVLVLQEMGPGWWDAVRQLGDVLPHSTAELPRGRRDVAILSRWPIRAFEVVEPRGPRGRPLGITAARVELEVPGAPVVVYGVHPPHGMTPAQWRVRNRHNAWIADRVAAERPGMPVVVAGDFNQTPWNGSWDDFLAASSLRDAAGSRFQLPTRAPLEPVRWYWLGIPIDHVLVSAGLAVRSYRIGPNLASDHRPVIADLALPAPPAP